MPIDYDNNRDLAKQIAANQPSTPSPRLADWLNVQKNLNTRYPVLPSNGTTEKERELKTANAFLQWQNKMNHFDAVNLEEIVKQVASPDYRKGWSPWQGLGDKKFSKISANSNVDGRLEVFGISEDKTLWNCWQERPNGRWHDWYELGGNRRIIDSISSARNKDGKLEVFALGEDLDLYHMRQQEAGSYWNNWESMGGKFSSGAIVGYNADGRLEIFLRGMEGEILANWQDPAGTHPTGWWGWRSHGENFSAMPKVIRNCDRLEIFTVNPFTGVLHRKWQDPKEQLGWTDWQEVRSNSETAVGLGMNTDNKIQMYIFNVNRERKTVFSWHEDHDQDKWSGWHYLGEGVPYNLNRLKVSNLENGRLSVFGRENGHIWHIHQTTGGWSRWMNLLGIESCSDFDINKTADGKEALFVINGQNQVQYSHQV